MKTKLLVPAAIAMALGLSSWSAGAATSYIDAAPALRTAPANTSDMDAPKSGPRAPEVATYVDKQAGSAPNALAWPAPAERAVKSGAAPANVFQLRDNAGG